MASLPSFIRVHLLIMSPVAHFPLPGVQNVDLQCFIGYRLSDLC